MSFVLVEGVLLDYFIANFMNIVFASPQCVEKLNNKQLWWFYRDPLGFDRCFGVEL
jgi:hypothetical protein